jgi:hypothetical protein
MTEQDPEQSKAEDKQSIRLFLIYIGVGLLLFGLVMSVDLVPDVLQMAGGPETLTLAQAAEVANSDRTYARIEGGEWDCATLRQESRNSDIVLRNSAGPIIGDPIFYEIFYTDTSQQTVVFVSLSGEVECDDLTAHGPTGYLYAMSDDNRQTLTNDARLARFVNAETFLEFCGFCGLENSLNGVALGALLLLSGFWLVVAGRSIR